MIRAIKLFTKRLPFPVFLRMFYLFYFSSRLPKLSRAARHYQIHPFSELDLCSLKRSETLFILGNGPSINQISAARWRAIESRDTIASNFWLYHPFVPNLYFFELIDPRAAPDIYAELVRLANSRASRYRSVVKIVTELHRERLSMLEVLSPEWRENIYTFKPVPLAARNEGEFAYALRYLKKKGVFQAAQGTQYLFKYGLTLTALLALAVRMQYRQIVLCGTDLRTSAYFYDDRNLYPDVMLPRRTSSGAFFTLTDIPWMVKIDSVMRVIKKELLDPAGIELYVENRSSALWPEIPEAPESLFTSDGILSS